MHPAIHLRFVAMKVSASLLYLYPIMQHEINGQKYQCQPTSYMLWQPTVYRDGHCLPDSCNQAYRCHSPMAPWYGMILWHAVHTFRELVQHQHLHMTVLYHDVLTYHAPCNADIDDDEVRKTLARPLRVDTNTRTVFQDTPYEPPAVTIEDHIADPLFRCSAPKATGHISMTDICPWDPRQTHVVSTNPKPKGIAPSRRMTQVPMMICHSTFTSIP